MALEIARETVKMMSKSLYLSRNRSSVDLRASTWGWNIARNNGLEIGLEERLAPAFATKKKGHHNGVHRHRYAMQHVARSKAWAVP